MFRKVKAKFIAISTIITALILIFISGGIYFSIRGQTNRSNNQVLDLICTHQSNFKYWNGGSGWGEQGTGWQGVDSEEQPLNSETNSSEQNSQYENPPEKPDGDKKDKKEQPPQTAQYFTVLYPDGFLRTEDIYNMDHIASLTEDEAKEIVAVIKASNKQEGTINKYYKYKIANLGTDVGVAVLDCQQSLKSVDTVRNYSLIFGSLGLVVMFVLLYFFSDLILKPVKESYEKQKNFISNASHELRTPLTIISANNELLEMKDGSNDQTENISKQIKKMNDMVAGLTMLSKFTDPESVKMDNVNVSNLAEEICMNYEHIFDEIGLSFEYNIEKDITFKTNEKLLSQLVYILLDNASKYGKNNVRISMRKNKDVLLIQQENEVEEIQQGDLNHYADRFYRAEDVRGKIEGSGIGLSIAKEIVNLFKGKMNIKGIYNRFTIEIEIKG